MSSRGRALVLLALALAGCAADPSPPPASSSPPGVPVVSAASVAVERCFYEYCFEPTVAADGPGRLFATDARAGAIGVSVDGGATWEQRPQPPAQPAGTVQRDAMVQVSPTGRLYYSSLVTASATDAVLGATLAIQVAWSDDAAATWAGNVQLGLAEGDSGSAVPDRQWLAFAPDGALYLSFGRPDSVWIARSEDGGATWSAWTQVIREVGYSVGGSGATIVDQAGRVFVTQCGTDPGGPTLVNLFVSDDNAATFDRRTLPISCNWFPMLSVAPDGGLVLAAVGADATLRLATSHDGGATFSEAVEWAELVTASPWPIAEDDGRVTLAWFSGADGVELRLSRGVALDAGNATTVAVGVPNASPVARTPAGTDFAHAARTPDGRVALAFVDGNSVRTATVSF